MRGAGKKEGEGRVNCKSKIYAGCHRMTKSNYAQFTLLMST